MSSDGPGVRELVCALVVAFGCWVIVGAMAYKNSRGEEPTALSEDECLSLALLTLTWVLTLALAVLVVGRVNPRASCPAVFIAAMLGMLSAIAFCIFTASWRRGAEHVFWVMGSVWVTSAIELATGLVGRVLRWLEGLPKAQDFEQQH